MILDLYQIDAFAKQVFEGNPACVCPLDEWLSETQMQAIAAENNVAETAFFVAQDNAYEIRWFTPTTEVDLCGHATLASAFVLFNHLGFARDEIEFESKSGLLRVTRQESMISLNFPAQIAEPAELPDGLFAALGLQSEDAVEACLHNDDFVLILREEQVLRSLSPDYSSLKSVDARGVIVSSTASDYDFVNRFFAPQVGIDEDPVTGSAFTKLIPYWAEMLGKPQLKAKQVSARGGEVSCELREDRVIISGSAVDYLKGQIHL